MYYFIMPFNHYAKIKRILLNQPPGWCIIQIDQPTKAKTFSGETRTYDHYYRIVNIDGKFIPYCKFQQIDRLAKILGKDVAELVVENDNNKLH